MQDLLAHRRFKEELAKAVKSKEILPRGIGNCQSENRVEFSRPLNDSKLYNPKKAKLLRNFREPSGLLEKNTSAEAGVRAIEFEGSRAKSDSSLAHIHDLYVPSKRRGANFQRFTVSGK